MLRGRHDKKRHSICVSMLLMNDASHILLSLHFSCGYGKRRYGQGYCVSGRDFCFYIIFTDKSMSYPDDAMTWRKHVFQSNIQDCSDHFGQRRPGYFKSRNVFKSSFQERPHIALCEGSMQFEITNLAIVRPGRECWTIVFLDMQASVSPTTH